MDDRGRIYVDPSKEQIENKRLIELDELSMQSIRKLDETQRKDLYNTLVGNKSPTGTDTTGINLPVNLENTARSAKSQLEEAMERMAELIGPGREGISKEERRKRTKAKKNAKKQRNK